jgi:NADP-dependent alcohol dehydrogenase
LPATGTEMNGNSVISSLTTTEKLAFSSKLVMPVFSILDPETCMSLPDRQIGNGVVDAFIHVMEQYLTYPINAKIQDRFAESILSTLIEVGPKVLDDKTNYDHMSNFMWAATMALNGLIGSGVPNDWATHGIGHELTALHNIDHARTLAIVLPGVMKIMASHKKDKILQYGARVWNITDGTDDQKIDQIISQTIVFFESMGLKTRLSDYQVGKDTINEIVNRFEKRGYALGENQIVGPEQIRLILENRL